MNEFELIDKYFAHLTPLDESVILGVGDDAALVSVPSSKQLVITTDTLVEGVHFLADWPAAAVGHRALAVNLSDIAAMGAIPRWVSLALTMPSADERWLQQFSQGFATLATHYKLNLIGGNLARGALNITVTLHGEIEAGRALLRDTAKVGDAVYVTGTIGGAALAIAYLNNELNVAVANETSILQPLWYPPARIAHGLVLAGNASSAIDISDGLVADLTHILQQSHLGATIDLALLPLNPVLRNYVDEAKAQELALSQSDDYELCFTVGPAELERVEELLTEQSLSFTRIGMLESELGLRGIRSDGHTIALSHQGYRHF